MFWDIRSLLEFDLHVESQKNKWNNYLDPRHKMKIYFYEGSHEILSAKASVVFVAILPQQYHLV